MNQQKSTENLSIAPLISDHKLKMLKLRILSTIIGYPFTHDRTDDSVQKQQEEQCSCNLSSAINYFVWPIIMILISTLVTGLRNYPIIIGVSIFIVAGTRIIQDCYFMTRKTIGLYILLSVISFLWSTHFSVLNFVVSQDQHPVIRIASIMLSTISVLSSLLTVRDSPIKQYSASTPNYQTFDYHSTYMMRALVCIPPLAAETILFLIYYTGQAPFSQSPNPPLVQDLIATELLMFINLGISPIFMLWNLGWISSVYNTYMFVINNIVNGLIFCDEQFRKWWVSLLLMGLNCGVIGISSVIESEESQGELKVIAFRWENISLLYWLAWFTSMFAAMIIFFMRKWQQGPNDRTYTRITVCFVMEVITVIGLYLLYYFLFIRESEIDIDTVLRIVFPVDIALYIVSQIFTQLRSPRTILGCFGCLHFSNRTEAIISIIQRQILRISSNILILAVSVIFTKNNYALTITEQIIGSFEPESAILQSYQISFVMNIVIPVIFYRTFKKCLSAAKSHSLHLSIIISYVLFLFTQRKTQEIASLYVYQNYQWAFVVLFMPILPYNPSLILLTPFTIPKKLQHQQQNWYRLIYVILSSFGLFVFLCTLGIFQFTMVFGLPVFWCVIPSTNYSAKNNNKTDINASINTRTPQQTLYKKMIESLPMHIYRGKQPGFYLFRVQKYLILIEVTNQCYGLYEIIEFRGLQAQQVTTCHAKEGQTIDRVISQVWDTDHSNRKPCDISDSLTTAVWPVQMVPQVMIPAQNQIKLTGIIENEKFYQLFKSSLIRAIIYYYNKSMKAVEQLNQSQRNPILSQFDQKAWEMCEDLHLVVNKQKCEQLFPYEFVEQSGIEVSYPCLEANSYRGNKKLPPIVSKTAAKKKERALRQFRDLIGETSEQKLSIGMKQGQTKQDENPVQQNILQANKQNSLENSIIHSSTHFTKKQKNMAVILTTYSSILGKVNYLQIEKIYRILRKQSEILPQLQYHDHQSISANAVGSALKIAINKYLSDESQITLQDFNVYDKNEFLGVLESKQFAVAVAEDREDVWAVNYHALKKMIVVKRIASVQVPLYVLGINWHVVKAVWNNLRYELLFAANDDDERYSIQTHEYLLRNLLVEACEEPYGYAGYYADNIHIV